MKVADTDILIVPGYMNSGEDHWQTRWENKLSTARRVQQKEWSKPNLDDWTREIADAVNIATKPVLIVAHSLGVPTFIHALPQINKRIAGAFLVTPPDVSDPTIRPKHLMTFGPYRANRYRFQAYCSPAATIIIANMKSLKSWRKTGARNSLTRARQDISMPIPATVRGPKAP
jgi:uncharacterized protein